MQILQFHTYTSFWIHNASRSGADQNSRIGNLKVHVTSIKVWKEEKEIKSCMQIDWKIFMGTDVRLLAKWKVRNLKIDKLVKNYNCVWFLTALRLDFCWSYSFAFFIVFLFQGKLITCEIPAKNWHNAVYLKKRRRDLAISLE